MSSTTTEIPLVNTTQNVSPLMTENASFKEEYRFPFLEKTEEVGGVTKGLYKAGKIVNGVIGVAVNVFASIPESASVAMGNITRSFKDVTDLISPMDLVSIISYGADRIKEKAAGKQCKDSIYKVGKMFFHFWCKLAEGAIWLGNHGVVELGRLAKGVGGFTIKTFKATVTICASSCSIIDSVIELGKEKTKNFKKHCLNLIEETGKIGLTLSGAYWATVPFALAALVTASAGLGKVVIDVESAHKRNWEQAQFSQSQTIFA